MGCFCSCFHVPDEEENHDVVVSNNHDVSNKQNCAPLSYVTQFFKNKYGVVSSNSALQTLPASAQGTYIATTEVGTNTPPRDILLENSSSSGNLELQGSVAVAGNGVGSSLLQLEHGLPERTQGAPQGTLLQNSSSSRNRKLQGHVPVQENGAGSGPLQLEHGLPKGHNVQVNLNSKNKDNIKLQGKARVTQTDFQRKIKLKPVFLHPLHMCQLRKSRLDIKTTSI